MNSNLNGLEFSTDQITKKKFDGMDANKIKDSLIETCKTKIEKYVKEFNDRKYDFTLQLLKHDFPTDKKMETSLLLKDKETKLQVSIASDILYKNAIPTGLVRKVYFKEAIGISSTLENSKIFLLVFGTFLKDHLKNKNKK